MSEPIGMTITIGGTLRPSLIKEFLKTINEDLSEIIGPTSESELRKEINIGTPAPIVWNATTDWGECHELSEFCVKHSLGFIHTIQAKEDYSPQVRYWVPGMEEEIIYDTKYDGEPTIDAKQVRPLINLLLEYAKQGEKALPLFIGNDNEDVKDILEKTLKHHSEFMGVMEKKLREFFPTPPKLPPLIIKE